MTALIPFDMLVMRPFEEHPLGSLVVLWGGGQPGLRSPCFALKVGNLHVGDGQRVEAALVIKGSPHQVDEGFTGELLQPGDFGAFEGPLPGIAGVKIAFDLSAEMEVAADSWNNSRAAIGLGAAGPFIVGGMGHGARALVAPFALADWRVVDPAPKAIAWASDWSVVIDPPGWKPAVIPVSGYAPSRYVDHPGRPDRGR